MLFWVVTQQVVVIYHGRFGTTHLSDIQGFRILISPSSLSDVKQQMGNKSFNRIRMAIGLYCSIGARNITGAI